MHRAGWEVGEGIIISRGSQWRARKFLPYVPRVGINWKLQTPLSQTRTLAKLLTEVLWKKPICLI